MRPEPLRARKSTGTRQGCWRNRHEIALAALMIWGNDA